MVVHRRSVVCALIAPRGNADEICNVWHTRVSFKTNDFKWLNEAREVL
jgi:hypothetical protein